MIHDTDIFYTYINAGTLTSFLRVTCDKGGNSFEIYS